MSTHPLPSCVFGNRNGCQQVVTCDHHHTDASAAGSNHWIWDAVTCELHEDLQPGRTKRWENSGCIDCFWLLCMSNGEKICPLSWKHLGHTAPSKLDYPRCHVFQCFQCSSHVNDHQCMFASTTELSHDTFRIDGCHQADQSQLLAAGFELLVRGDLSTCHYRARRGRVMTQPSFKRGDYGDYVSTYDSTRPTRPMTSSLLSSYLSTIWTGWFNHVQPKVKPKHSDDLCCICGEDSALELPQAVTCGLNSAKVRHLWHGPCCNRQDTQGSCGVAWAFRKCRKPSRCPRMLGSNHEIGFQIHEIGSSADRLGEVQHVIT